jgi:signal peptidase II
MWTSLSTILCAAAITMVLDQISKYVVTTKLPVSNGRPLTSSVGLRLVLNRKAGFVRLSVRTAVIVWLAAAIAVGYVAMVGVSLPLAGIAGLGLAFGGATSNLSDRVWRGEVVDFIALGWWPVFNLADAAMVIGAAIVVWIGV